MLLKRLRLEHKGLKTSRIFNKMLIKIEEVL